MRRRERVSIQTPHDRKVPALEMLPMWDFVLFFLCHLQREDHVMGALCPGVEWDLCHGHRELLCTQCCLQRGLAFVNVTLPEGAKVPQSLPVAVQSCGALSPGPQGAGAPRAAGTGLVPCLLLPVE